MGRETRASDGTPPAAILGAGSWERGRLACRSFTDGKSVGTVCRSGGDRKVIGQGEGGGGEGGGQPGTCT